jgi:hypothetical protein
MSFERQSISAQLVVELVDRFADDRRVRGRRPRPIGDSRFSLVAEVVANQRQDFDQPIELETVENPSGHRLFFGTVLEPERAPGRPPLNERRRRRQIAAGRYVLEVRNDAYQNAERDDIVLPQARNASPYIFRLEPGSNYPFPRTSTLGAGLGPTLLRGCLLDTDATGIGGAEVEVAGQSNLYRVDAGGQWVLVFADSQPTGNVTVRFRLPQQGGGFATVDVQNVPLSRGVSSSFLQASLSGETLAQEGAPVEDAVIRVLGRPGTTTSRNGGRWRYVFPVGLFPNNQGAVQVDVEARHPDGTTLLEQNVAVTAGAVTPVPTFRF